MTIGSYSYNIDLRSTYRSISIKPSDYSMGEIKLQLTCYTDVPYTVDISLMMAAAKAPSIFHSSCQAIKRCMEKKMLPISGIS